MKNLVYLFLVLISVLSFSCTDKEVKNIGEKQGAKPIYADPSTAFKISSISERKLEKPGRIYFYQNLLFVNERGEGIHIYDISNLQSPVYIKFIIIPGNTDMAIQNNLMYVNNINDLVILDLINNANEVGRIKSMFSINSLDFPQNYTGYFECVDRNKGMVIGWEIATLDNPKCIR
jgi:hypothetical protein